MKLRLVNYMSAFVFLIAFVFSGLIFLKHSPIENYVMTDVLALSIITLITSVFGIFRSLKII